MELTKSAWIAPQRAADPVAELAPVKKAWKQYKSNRDHDIHAVYGYLEAVYGLVQRWKKRDVADSNSLKALKAHDSPIRMWPDPYARVIYCTSDSSLDSKMRSKWVRAMRNVEKN